MWEKPVDIFLIDHPNLKFQNIMELKFQQLILESFRPVYFWRYTSYVVDWLFWEDPKNLSAHWINVFGQIKENVMERGYEL